MTVVYYSIVHSIEAPWGDGFNVMPFECKKRLDSQPRIIVYDK